MSSLAKASRKRDGNDSENDSNVANKRFKANDGKTEEANKMKFSSIFGDVQVSYRLSFIFP